MFLGVRVTSNAVGRMIFLLNLLNDCFHSFLVMCCMFSIMPLFNYYSFRVLSFFFKLILTQRPGYLFPDLIGACSDRTSNFIFPSVSPEASVLVRGILLWNQLPLAIKNDRSVAAFERDVMERMRTNLT
jgi:hypothetical protein